MAGPGADVRPIAGVSGNERVETLDVPSTVRVAPNERVLSLDGLRGVGALVVVVYHALLIVPAISAMYLAPANGVLASPPMFSVRWWMYSTPLRLLWGGHEAVLVFFVLSGMVLTAPLVRRPRHNAAWLGYYRRRLCRLYVPVWAALLLAVLVCVIVPRRDVAGSSWLVTHPDPSPYLVVHDAALLLGTSNLDSPLWSLRWEVLFSLLLPFMFLIMRVIRVERWPVLAIGLLAVAAAAGQVPAVRHHLPVAWMTAGSLQYLPVFAVGMIIAMCPERLQQLRHTMQHRTVPVVWTIVALVLAASPTYLGTAPAVGTAFVLQLTTLAGVTMIVLSALTLPAVTRALESKAFQYAGSRSFSIYLVHEPILVSVALAVHAAGALPWLLLAPLAIAAALVVAEGFYWLMEKPAIRLSRRLDIRVS